MNILVSACLLGVCSRYDGTGTLNENISELMKNHTLIPVCPEIYGGLSTPRPPAEIQPDRQVINTEGVDVTSQYERGAEEALKLAKLYNCKLAILKERSPSCGSGVIYDGTFTRTKIPGDGKTAELLKAHGITVIGESRISEYFSPKKPDAL